MSNLRLIESTKSKELEEELQKINADFEIEYQEAIIEAEKAVNKIIDLHNKYFVVKKNIKLKNKGINKQVPDDYRSYEYLKFRETGFFGIIEFIQERVALSSKILDLENTLNKTTGKNKRQAIYKELQELRNKLNELIYDHSENERLFLEALKKES